jgi:hypothetical protein
MHYYERFKVVYEKTTYKNSFFVGKNLLFNLKFDLFE